MTTQPSDAVARFRRAYAELRAREGRGRGGVAELLALPHLEAGPWSDAWRVRARTYDHFVGSVLRPFAAGSSLRVLDLGAGNGWLCYRLAGLGHRATAVDWRIDDVDGLGAAAGYLGHVEPLFPRIAASFDELPFDDGTFDLAVFNASLHYTTDLAATLVETVRVLACPGRVAVLDSPFYPLDRDGAAMVREKRTGTGFPPGVDEDALLALPSIEYLTRERLADASFGLGLEWRRHRVRYPLRYELRPLVARIRGRRAPSRFDVWEGRRGDETRHHPQPRG